MDTLDFGIELYKYATGTKELISPWRFLEPLANYGPLVLDVAQLVTARSPEKKQEAATDLTKHLLILDLTKLAELLVKNSLVGRIATVASLVFDTSLYIGATIVSAQEQAADRALKAGTDALRATQSHARPGESSSNLGRDQTAPQWSYRIDNSPRTESCAFIVGHAACNREQQFGSQAVEPRLPGRL